MTVGFILEGGPSGPDKMVFTLLVQRLRPGAKVGIAIESGRLVVEPQQRPRYTLNELLAQCNPKAKRTKEDREWLGNGPAGAEIL